MKKILLIDDNINFLKPLSNLLQKNFDVYMATGVKEAIQILEWLMQSGRREQINVLIV